MNMLRLANLVLEDGTRLQGSAVGAEADVVFVLAFNTSITGYRTWALARESHAV